MEALARMRLRQVLEVRSLSLRATSGRLRIGSLDFPCALGRGGIKARKREGDGGTPLGNWRLGAVWYRADRVSRPRTALQVRPIRRDDGWCDAASDRNYNRWVRLPYAASAEALWRQDAVYDIIVVLEHNQTPRVRGHGSAVFLHLARPGFSPTEGCIAVSRPHMLRLLASLAHGVRLRIAR
jgi:L,D-peptidoglycan transpeptidase YkuD (ErfK/YbiS/YcfS/YnhG family)